MLGDSYVTQPSYESTLGVTIHAAPAAIWPWLVQMGYRRGGLYSYDWLDRLFGYLDRPSADRVLPEWQQLKVKDLIPIGRGGAFPVRAIEPYRSLVLGGYDRDVEWSWELALTPQGNDSTRLISRNRLWIRRTVRSSLTMLLMAPAAFIMTRKMLLNIKPRAESADALLDCFMPRYDVVERHRIDVAAPADVTFAALMDMSLDDSAVIRGIFRAREVLLGAHPAESSGRRSLVEMTTSLGWVLLAMDPGRELVMGAVTRPWEADVVFRGIPAEEFATFDEPDCVKIVWTLRADPAPNGSVARTETRAVATDAEARRKFRRYWTRFSPGIVLIRDIAQRFVKRDAESRVNRRAAA